MRKWIGLIAFALVALAVYIFTASTTTANDPWVVYEGEEGPGADQHIVLISADQEYRTEEGLPQLGKILAERHGFTSTVLFPIDPETGAIDPSSETNVPGTEALQTADLMIIGSRFLHLPEEQMQHIDDYINAGKPVLGLRTATHAFRIPEDDPYHHYSFNYDGDDWPQGFGRQVLGETWVDHHGDPGNEATRGRIAPDAESHPILNGVDDGAIFVPTDVYAVSQPLPDEARVLLLGEIVEGMDEDDPAVEGERNDPMMPIAWTHTYTAPDGTTGQAFTTTTGSARDLLNESLRRLIVNASYHLLDMEVPDEANVDLVGDYDPSPRGFEDYREGVMPDEHALD